MMSKVDVARMYKELENRAKEEAGKKAKRVRGKCNSEMCS